MLIDNLTVLGLDPDDITTYQLLLATGPTTVGNLAKKTGQVRSSLYGFLKRLQERGLVTESRRGAIKIVSAAPAEKINLLFEERREELTKNQRRYQALLPELQKLQRTALSTPPTLQLFTGTTGLQQMVKDIFLYKNLITQSFWPIKDMLEILSPDFFRYMNKQRIKNNIYVEALWPRGQVVTTKQYPFLGAGEKFKREFRIAPPGVEFSMGYWIYGSKVAFVSSRQENFGFIIDSAEFAAMLRVQFKVIWKLSKKLTPNPQDSEEFIQELNF